MTDTVRSDEGLSDGTALRRSVMRLTRKLRQARRRGALASTKLGVLGELHRSGEQTPRQLADVERVQPQSLTRTLAALERDGLVYRRRDARDGRRSWIGLTSQGLDALGGDMAERDRWLEGQIDHLSPAERAILMLAVELIDRIADDASAPESIDDAA
jgi:DNA-binding MarR family transcriptional regulator